MLAGYLVNISCGLHVASNDSGHDDDNCSAHRLRK